MHKTHQLKAMDVRERVWSPEERLCWRIIVDGLADGDIEWFEEGFFDRDWWFRFDNICFILGVRVGKVREWCLGVVRDGRGKEVKEMYSEWCKELMSSEDYG